MPLGGENLATLLQALSNMIRAGEATKSGRSANDRVFAPLSQAGAESDEMTNMAIRCLNRAHERVAARVKFDTAVATLSTSDADDDGKFAIETYLSGLLEAEILSVRYKQGSYFEPLNMASEFMVTSRDTDVTNEATGYPTHWYYCSEDHALGLYPRPTSGSDNLQVSYVPRPTEMWTYETLGTVAIDASTPTVVTGTGTRFTEAVAGYEFGVRPAAGVLPRKWFRISTTPSTDTTLAISAWDGPTISGKEFVICSDCTLSRRFTSHGPDAILQTAASIWFDFFNRPDLAQERRAVADAAINEIRKSIMGHGKRVTRSYA